jgi:hypothetical protein
MEEGSPGQIHGDPATYLEMVVAEVPGYQELEDRVAEATRKITATSILEFGVGTGETTMRVLARHPAGALSWPMSPSQSIRAMRSRRSMA